MDTPSTAIGPGLGAFVAFFVLAVVLWLLMRNMNGRMRRMAYREQERVAALEAREAARTASHGGTKRGRKRPKPPPAAQEPDRADPAP
jgi:hypothetical protein